MKRKFFANTNESILKTNVLRSMIFEATKVVDCVTEDMIMKKTGGYQVNITGVIVEHSLEKKDEFGVILQIDDGNQLMITFDVQHKPNDLVREFSWVTSIFYDTSTILFNDDYGALGLTEAVLKEVFQENLVEISCKEGEEALEFTISARAFPEFFD